MVVFPNAKINLGLNVLRRRDDGYHDISTVFVPYKGLSDVLEVVFADEPGLTEYGLLTGCEPEKNLCFRAWRLIDRKSRRRGQSRTGCSCRDVYARAARRTCQPSTARP